MHGPLRPAANRPAGEETEPKCRPHRTAAHMPSPPTAGCPGPCIKARAAGSFIIGSLLPKHPVSSKKTVSTLEKTILTLEKTVSTLEISKVLTVFSGSRGPPAPARPSTPPGTKPAATGALRSPRCSRFSGVPAIGFQSVPQGRAATEASDVKSRRPRRVTSQCPSFRST